MLKDIAVQIWNFNSSSFNTALYNDLYTDVNNERND